MLFNMAFERNIVIVSPSTLLATLRTIESIWRQEKQSKYAQEIAFQSGKLYDKFVNFLSDFEDIGKRLDSTYKSYEGAKKKLTEGRGDLISTAEKIRELGAKNTKSIPQNLLK
jgi:DNA recombination protein RmuC